jgi:uncharacterized protein (DUF1778 family)
MRLPPELRPYLIDAAAVSSESLSAFLLISATSRAHGILQDPPRYQSVTNGLEVRHYSTREPKPDAERTEARIPPDTRDFLLDAAERVYESLTSFVVHAAVLRAHQVLQDPERFALAVERVRRMPYSKI